MPSSHAVFVRAVYAALLCTACVSVFRHFQPSTMTIQPSSDTDRSHLTPPDAEAPCTFAAFRQQVHLQGYFPTGGGRWILGPDQPPYIQPGFCKIRYPRMPSDKMAKCMSVLSERRMNFLMDMGDSNGRKYHQALYGFVPNCEMGTGKSYCSEFTSTAGFTFGTKTQPVGSLWNLLMERYYQKCLGSTLMKCHTPENKTQEMYLMHIHLMNMLQTEIVLYPDEAFVGNRTVQHAWTMSKIEFTLKHFFVKQFPNISIIILPFNHLKITTLARAQIEIELFYHLVRMYKPPTAKVIFLPTFAEFEAKRVPEVGALFINRTYEEGLLATEVVRKMNGFLYDTLAKDLLDPSSGIYGFLDLLDLSLTREEWSPDGMHMEPVWYDAVMSLFWETLCNSAEMDAF